MVNKNLLNATFQNNPSILSGYRNKIINGDFSIWQRSNNASVLVGTSSGYYGPDRWLFRGTTLTGGTIQLQKNNADVGWGGRNRINISRTGCTNVQYLEQRIENLTQYSGKRITVGFTVFPNTTQTMNSYVAGNFGSGGTPSTALLINQTDLVAPANTFTKFVTSFDVPDLKSYTFGTSGDDYLYFRITLNDTDNTTIRISSVFLVEGDATLEADPFSPRHPQQELALCQRYYERFYYKMWGTASAANQYFGNRMNFAVTKRVNPTATALSNSYSNLNALAFEPDIYGCGFPHTSIAAGNVVSSVVIEANAEL